MTWPLNGNEAEGDLVLTQTLLLLLSKSSCSYANYQAFTWEKQRGLFQNKVTSSLACIHGQVTKNATVKWPIGKIISKIFLATFSWNIYDDTSVWTVGGAVASWLVRSTPERAVRVRALAGDIVLCSWTRHLTLTVPLSTQVYKWVPANCWGNLTNFGEVTCDGLPSRPGEVEILLAASCYRNRDKLR